MRKLARWEIDEIVQHMNEAACVTVSAINFTDEEPPLARLDLNYDAYTHNAFGRMIKVGLEYTLGAGN